MVKPCRERFGKRCRIMNLQDQDQRKPYWN